MFVLWIFYISLNSINPQTCYSKVPHLTHLECKRLSEEFMFKTVDTSSEKEKVISVCLRE